MLLPSPQDLKDRFPLSFSQKEFVELSRKKAKSILDSQEDKLVIVVGPCSIHDPKSALEYAKRLSLLSQKVQDSCFLVMRVYVEKSRSTLGWKGMLYDPHLDGSDDILAGLEKSRQLFLAITEAEVPIAVEFVDPLFTPYFDDLITWGFIGARSCGSQPHRQLVSHLPFPVGFKNSVEGDILSATEGVITASSPHTFLQTSPFGNVCVVKSGGNPYSHIVLRGGRQKTNYDPLSVQSAIDLLKGAEVSTKIMIDCSHGNSQKNAAKQKEVFQCALEQVGKGNKNILGVMLESHLHGGNQSPYQSSSSLRYGVSITDPCLDWASTEELVLSSVLASTSLGEFSSK